MPADYQSTARALALPVSPIRSPSTTHDHHHQPSWLRRQSGLTGRRSLDSQPTVRTRLRKYYRDLESYGAAIERNFKPWQIYLSFVVGILTIVLGVLFLIYNERIFGWIEPYAEKWKNLRGGWMILWMMCFTTGFPPIIGYSSTLTIAGFVYGFPEGWFIVSTATIVGSLTSFLTSRYLFSSFVHRLLSHDTRFTALSLVLKHDGLKLLCMIRLCPLPYSLSNGAISTFPSVHPLKYALATAIVTPKLLIHIFIGTRLRDIARSGEKMSVGTKAVNWGSIILGGVLGIAVGWYIYRRTMQRARELETEEEVAITGQRPVAGHVRRFSDEPDEERTATLLEDDQIDFLDPDEGYRDEWGLEDGGDAKVLQMGSRDEEQAVWVNEQVERR